MQYVQVKFPLSIFVVFYGLLFPYVSLLILHTLGMYFCSFMYYVFIVSLYLGIACTS